MSGQVEFPLQITYPLGGAVTQAFSILAGAQIGLVNVRLGNSSDPELERRILDEVGSYGRQIGRISEVLAILVRETRLLERDLPHADRAAIHDFLGQAEKVTALKTRRRPRRLSLAAEASA